MSSEGELELGRIPRIRDFLVVVVDHDVKSVLALDVSEDGIDLEPVFFLRGEGANLNRVIQLSVEGCLDVLLRELDTPQNGCELFIEAGGLHLHACLLCRLTSSCGDVPV